MNSNENEQKYKPNESLFSNLFQKMMDEETRNVHNQLLDDKAMAKKLAKMCLSQAELDLKMNRR